MSLETVLNQVWRIVRLAGAAGLAATQASTHVTTSGAKAGIIAGAVAFVEVAYRAAVPAQDKTLLGKYLAAVKAVAADPAFKPVETAVGSKLVAEIPTPLLSDVKSVLPVLTPPS